MTNDGTIVTFYSYKGGTGRTTALANVAWIMAAAGHKVLVVDWDLESPGLHKFFHPFLDQNFVSATPGVIEMLTDYAWAATTKHETAEQDWHLEYARILRHAVTLEWDFPGEGTLDFVSAGRQNRDYSSLITSMDWDNFYDRLGGGQFFDALRADMRRNYDYTLIDSRTGLSDIADICTVHFPDVLVDCFTLSDQSIDGAAAIAAHIDERYRERGIRILPVPMRIEFGENAKVEAGRAYARARFDRFPSGMTQQRANRYWLSVEIPYRPYYAFEETLATFGDAPGSPNSMLAAFERLANEITEGRVAGYPPIPEELRTSTLERFTRRGPSEVSDVLISYVSEDRPWVDWMALVLGRAGFRVVTRSVDTGPQEPPDDRTAAGHTIVLISPAYVVSQRAQRAWDALSGRASAPYRRLTTVRVLDAPLSLGFNGPVPLDLTGLGEREGAEALVRALGRPGQNVEYPAEQSRVGPRYPGAARTAPPIWNVNRRNAVFTGRGGLLEELRDHLLGTTQRIVLPQALHGLGGVGKTQVALEYAHRFKADYDLIWWVSAQSPDSIRGGLASLAEQIGLRVGDSIADAANAALEALRRGEPTSRWLLVFDNADNPEELKNHLPGGDGHVIITSRDPAWTQFAQPLAVDVFTEEESAAHLFRRVQEISDDNARAIGTALGYLPLAIEQAAAWLASTFMPAGEYLEALENETASTLALSTEAFSQPVAMTWNVTFRQLREASPAAARLLELLAFFSSVPISLDLIYSEETAEVLAPYDETLRDKLVLGKHVREISRFALARVDQGNNAIQVHPLVQTVIRHGMQDDPDLTEETCHDVHRILLGARPKHGDTDDPANWPALDEILPHVQTSRAAECDEENVRQMLTDLIRYQWKRGNFESAMEAGEELTAAWQGKLGKDHWQWLFLQSQIANVLRSQGDYARAYALDQDVMNRQLSSPTLGPAHPHTLITAGNLAADLRAMGRFREALDLDIRTYEQAPGPWGEEHPRTLMVAHNLAIDYRLNGDPASAFRFDTDNLNQRRAVLGDDHPYTLFSEANVARDLREAGRYEESVTILRDVYQRYLDVLGDQILDTLRTGKSLAVSLRKAGRAEEALALAEETYARYQRHFPESPDTLPADLEVAAGMSALGDKVGARDRVRAALAKHIAQMGEDHPYTLMIENNLGCYLRGAGDLDEARERATRVVTGLEAQLGPEHPFVLSATVNLGNCLGDLRRFAEAEALERGTLPRLVGVLGEDHPDTNVCRANLSVTLEGMGRTSEASELRSRAASGLLVLAEHGPHPTLADARAGVRINRDLELQPV
ncbi:MULTISPECIES: FxSxx-COOH system tetratricopeptide repeat protein [Actinomadura]|uniref:Tetratricopeptide repeat protein n=1 Tax=Actinomadura litoris TaxID=2678616 RepID=A0A7K1KY61_9ACTN|nr:MULTISPECIES: FxSxx-COOH system tetratricopeptide repeat protein [Actinomadura]MBT2209043.1 tetratricopeptide repeat protein [Actinomadura sp. NEAU-AAG7]MUN37140.1 tetratricopeptide repeat protein [Actinomadura litoris]